MDASLKMFTRFACAFFGVVLMALLGSCGMGDDGLTMENIRGGEKRATLSPTLFTGKSARSYKVAKEIPEVLDGLYCYCDCKKHSGHKSLLTCYVDRHAEYCPVCMDEALVASKLHKEGMDALEIRRKIDKRFASKRH